jgi:hypothetical protein
LRLNDRAENNLLLEEEIKSLMKKRTYKLLKRSLLVFLALVTFLLVMTPMPVLPSDVQIVKDMTNNKIMDEDFHLFCLATLPDQYFANESETIHEYQDNNYEISTRPT